MKSNQQRKQLIVDLIKSNFVSNQSQLTQLLAAQGINVTQATLSRDLKMLRISKISTPSGHVYVLPENIELPLVPEAPKPSRARLRQGVKSVAFSGNIAVIKTRNGYASALAYDIDMSHNSNIVGTISGSDTVFAVVREELTREQVVETIHSLGISPEEQ